MWWSKDSKLFADRRAGKATWWGLSHPRDLSIPNRNHKPEVQNDMADIHKLSEQVIDYAERAANVADAAKGDGKNGAGAKWLLLPAAGAAVYAFVKTDFFSRGAKVVAGEAKTRASELPDDLMKAVRQTSQKTSRRTTSPARSTTRSTSNGRSRRRTGSRSKAASSR